MLNVSKVLEGENIFVTLIQTISEFGFPGQDLWWANKLFSCPDWFLLFQSTCVAVCNDSNQTYFSFVSISKLNPRTWTTFGKKWRLPKHVFFHANVLSLSKCTHHLYSCYTFDIKEFCMNKHFVFGTKWFFSLLSSFYFYPNSLLNISMFCIIISNSLINLIFLVTNTVYKWTFVRFLHGRNWKRVNCPYSIFFALGDFSESEFLQSVIRPENYHWNIQH